MKNKTFILWLTAGIMLLSIIANIFNSMGQLTKEKADIQETTIQPGVKEYFVMPSEYTKIQSFGATYDQELGQWTMQTQIVFSTETNTSVYAPLSGQIGGIEKTKDGGSCISLECYGTKLQLFPIYDLFVLEGEWVNQGERLGRTSSSLNVYAERDGQPINPQTLSTETTFFHQGRSDKRE